MIPVYPNPLPYQNPFAAPEPAGIQASNANPQLYETVMRRRVRAELTELKTIMRETHLQDEMTGTISIWAENFWEALLLNADDDEIFRGFSQLMQELLTDPFFGAPLDEEALLGSDGHTYGKKSHAVWEDRVEEMYKRRSPMDPDDPTFLDLRPHPVARYMVCWLQRYNLLQVSEDIERAYNEIIPRQRLARIERLRESKAARDRQRNERIAQNERDLNAEIETILEPLIEVRDLIRNNANELIERAEEIRENDSENIQVERDAIQRIDADITVIDLRNTQLIQRVNEVGELISETEKENAKLEIAINKTRKAIKKQRKGWVSGVLKTAVVVAACAAATWGVGALVGGGVAISPASGGAKVAVAIIL